MRKTAIAFFILPLLVLLAPTIVLGQYVPGSGLANSPHDFSVRGKNAPAAPQDPGTSTINTDSLTGACTYCHTPHRALQTRLLWNHKLGAAPYTWSDGGDKTVGGTTLPTISATWTGPSRFCLSCHDGTVAIGDIAWFNKAARPGNTLDDKQHANDVYQIARVDANNNWTTGGSEMKGNHPVAHPYPYDGAGSTYNSTTSGTGVYFRDFRKNPTAVGIRLFVDNGGIVGASTNAAELAGKAGIECTSCHGVHNEGEFVEDAPLLRGTLDGNTVDANGKGYICMKCHPRAATQQ